MHTETDNAAELRSGVEVDVSLGGTDASRYRVSVAEWGLHAESDTLDGAMEQAMVLYDVVVRRLRDAAVAPVQHEQPGG